ncbi:HAD family hydrolase [Microlunatus sp. Y2014]|uniref:HAD family hydrolase n=1 Tax=Microlunatus sp. Y2014 TaxID=3418488 RepID=UPI003DA781D3
MSSLRPRLVVTDLDGTFLSPDGTVSQANAEAVVAAREAGLEFLIATGRPLRWLDEVSDIAGVHPLVIASNGAMLYDTGSGEVLRSHPIDPAVASDVVMDLRREVTGTSFAIEQGWRYGVEPTYLRRPLGQDIVFEGPFEKLVGDAPFVKLLAQNHQYSADRLAELAGEVIGDRLTVTHSSDDGRGLLELSPAGVSKASMLAEHCRARGIAAEEVAAFGDMPNDLAMLQWAGMPYVMEGAHPAVLGVGTVIGSNADSAVGGVITGWLD